MIECSYETSARRRANVDEVFVDLCRQIIRRDNSSNRDSTRNDERDYRRTDRDRDDRPRKNGASSRRRRKDGPRCNIL